MGDGAKKYFDEIKKLIDWLNKEQYQNIINASELLVDAIIEKRTIWAFGCTHSSILTAEITYRAGGLMLFNGIFGPGMNLNVIPPTLTSKIENLPDYGTVIFDEYKIKTNDVLLVFSSSGRNNVPVDMALEAKKKGVTVIAITSLKYSKNVESKHKSGKKLYQIADLVIDNGAELGDAVIKFDNLEQKVGPVSTISGATILNAITSEIVSILLKKGIKPPIFMSGNVDNGQELNNKLLENYKDVIKYMPYL